MEIKDYIAIVRESLETVRREYLCIRREVEVLDRLKEEINRRMISREK